MPRQPAARAFRASRSKRPSGSWAMTALGMPRSRISAVSARVSIPPMPMMSRAFSHWPSGACARWFEGAVMAAWSTTPRTPPPAAFRPSPSVSTSCSLTPTLPMWGKVKVTIWPE